MQTKFYVSHSSQQMGPYAIDEIVNFVSEGTLSPLDYIYDEEKADWIVFIEHASLAEKVKALKPKAPPAPAEKTDAKVHKLQTKKEKKADLALESASPVNHEWFVLKGENKFGPFVYTDVVKMLQQGAVFEFDFVWHQGMEGWHRIAELDDYSKDRLRQLKDSAMPEISEVFFRRRFRRVNYGGTILVHDNKKVWKGTAMEVSEGGAGVVMENAMIVPGQELYLHFKPGDGVPPFNAICEVVSKEYVSDLRNRTAPIKYGLKFKTLSSETQKFLKEYAKKAA
jgi:PilZ domain/GYF domain 2